MLLVSLYFEKYKILLIIPRWFVLENLHDQFFMHQVALVNLPYFLRYPIKQIILHLCSTLSRWSLWYVRLLCRLRAR